VRGASFVAVETGGGSSKLVSPPPPQQQQQQQGGGDGALHAFLREYLSGWDEDEGLDALGLDSLDLVQMRNAFIKDFAVQVPLSVFAAPNQTLGELIQKLQPLLAASK